MLFNVCRKHDWYCIIPGLLVLLWASGSVTAQSKKDSLKSGLHTTTGKERVELLLDLSRLTRQKNPDSAIILAQEALSISQRIGDIDQQSKSLQRLGFNAMAADRDTLALEYMMSALELDRQRGNRAAEADALHLLGRFYMGQNNDTRALEYFFEALEIQEDEGMKAEAGITLSYIGDLYSYRKETEQAVYFFKQATQIALEARNLKQISIAGVKAGNNLFRLGQEAEADRYFNMALEAARDIPSIHAESGIVTVMSAAYQNKMLYDKALDLNQDFLETAMEHESKILQARCYENMAGIYAAQANLDVAADNLLHAFHIFQSMHFPVSQVVDKLMHVYLDLGMADSAIYIGKEAVKQARATGNLKARQHLLEGLVAAYQAKGDFNQVARSQQELLTLNEIIYDEDKTRQMSEMEVRYKTEQKAQAIALLKNEQAQANLLRNGLLTGLGFLVVIGLLIFNRQRLRIAKSKTDLENVRLKQQQLRQDLEFKNRQLTTHSLHLVQKNKIMQVLKTNISKYQNSQGGGSARQLRNMQHLIDHSFNLDQDWEEFRMHFEAVHNGFFEALKKHSPALTTSELRLSALVKLNLNIKETAAILNISPDSVKTARYRLRKKLNLRSDQDLSEFLMDVEQQVMS